ncbi:AraC family transcriptional regulator [Streptomyces sp. NPDC020965]|uniref:AraC family transcriptional regulator n=1 Tax=Streptomyces sp. NPDC020965 TaxID=3365105 RepID=UPI0037B4CEFD
MSQNGHLAPYGAAPGTAIVVGTFTLPKGAWFPTHRHPVHQLAWSRSGLLAVRTAAGAWLLPPSMALWIPARLPHATGAMGTVDMRSPYLDPLRCPDAWTEPTVVSVGPLLSALIDHLHREDLTARARERAESVVFDVLDPLPVTSVSVTEPRDPRARAVARALAGDPRDGRGLEAWGSEVGASARTLARLFTAETGLTFGQWRERLRMQASMPLLAGELPIEAVARRVGYGSASSFVAAFHRIVGLTPRQYFPMP